jgi:hypothetical protein
LEFEKIKDTKILDSKIEFGTFNITNGALNGVLIGNLFFNESKLIHQVRIETETNEKGGFKILENNLDNNSEDFEEEKYLLDFAFNFKSSSFGSKMSYSEFTGKYGSGIKQFLFFGTKGFLINLYFNNSTQYQLFRISGKKLGADDTPNFFARFGPTLIIAIFFIGTRMLTSNLKK